MITSRKYVKENNNFGVFISSKYDGKIINREDINLPSRLSIGSSTDVVSQIRKVFKKNHKEFNFTGVKDNEKCMKCNGSGYYEVNFGDIGYSKSTCPDCLGTGFNEAILSKKVNSLNIGNILNMPIKDLILWLDEVGLKNLSEKISLYVDIGLGNLSLSKTVNKMSYHEESLMFIANFISEDKEGLALNNFFINVMFDEMENIISNLNELAQKYHKKIIILKN